MTHVQDSAAAQETAAGFRLSPQQRRLWLLLRGESPSPYECRCSYLLEGELDRAALARALARTATRHEALRTAFPRVPGMSVPLQVIRDGAAPLLTEVDLRGEEVGEDRLARRLSAGFDLEAGEALRALLVIRGDSPPELILQMPALCADAATLDNLAAELLAACAGQPEGDDAPFQLADLAEWQNQLLESADTALGVERWRERWREMDVPAHLSRPLPLESGPGDGPFRPDEIPVPLTGDQAAALADLARRWQVPVPALFLALWQAVLVRSLSPAAGEDVLVGVLHPGRGYEELETALGPFARFLPVVARVEPGDSLSGLARHAGQAMEEAGERQEHFSWERAAGWSGDGPSFFPACFEALEGDWVREAGGLRLTRTHRAGIPERFKLLLSAVETGGAWKLALRYDRGLFTPAAAALLAGRVAALSLSALELPEAVVADLELLGPEERRQLLRDWSRGPAPGRAEGCLHRLLEEQAARTPERLAVTCAGRSLTYGELNATANRLARRLCQLGVGVETRVALGLERSVEAVAAVFAVLKAGGAYVPLDPSQPADRLAFLLADTGAPVLLTDRRRSGSLDAAAEAAGVRTVYLEEEAAGLADLPEEDLDGGAGPRNLAYAIYTSGSTGRPKGVLIEHRSAVNLLTGLEAAVLAQHPRIAAGPANVSLNAPLIFDASVQQLVWLLRGHTLHVVPEEARTDGAALLAFVRERHLDVFDCTPSLLRMLLGEGLLDGGPAPEVVLTAGEAINEGMWEELRRAERTAFYNIYGPTECTVDATWHRVGSRPGGPTIGRPLAGYEVYLLDPARQPVPAGAPGELCVGGAGLARGYLDRPDVTAERFIPHPFRGEPGERLYRTGDLARYGRGGDLEYLGRIDHQVKIRGFRIELGEIEAVLASHPLVTAAAAVARPGAGDVPMLVAYAVGAGDADAADAATLAEILAFLRERLPAYMVPAALMFLPALPLTPSGKVDRKALPAPVTGRGDAYVAPAGPVEELLAAIWQEVLGGDRIGASDDFFELGGHSLLATQVISRVRRAFHLDLPVRHLFEAPTVAGLALRIEAARAVSPGIQAPPLVPVPRDGDLPASFGQQRLWFLHQLDPASRPAYNLPLGLRLDGPLDIPALERGFAALVRRHETLRTVLVQREDQVLQSILEPTPPPLPVVDLAALPPPLRENEARRLAAEEALAPFDLECPPVLRLRLLRSAPDEHLLLCTVHHVSGDGWSTGILARDVTELYAAEVTGRESLLPDLPVQYADYAVWQRSLLQGEALDAQLAYWRGQLAGIPALLSLPTDRPRPRRQTFRGGIQPLAFPDGLATRAGDLARGEGATAFMVLLAAFSTLLSRYSGQGTVVVGTPVANRHRTEVEDVIGLFVNTLALRADLDDPELTFRGALRRVREAALGAYVHQDLPFEKLVEELEPERDLGRSPLFQAMLVVHNAPRRTDASSGLSLDFLEPQGGTAKFDLTLALVEAPDSLAGGLEYNADLFDTATAARLAAHFQALLAQAMDRPEAALADLQILTSAERHQLLVDWNAAGPPLDLRPVHEWIAARAEEDPETVAVTWAEGAVSRGGLRRRAASLARALALRGVRTGDRVGICAERSPDLVAGVLAILEAGAAFVPLEPSHPADRLAFLIADSGAALVLASQDLAGRLPVPSEQILILEDCAEEEEPGLMTAAAAGLDGLAYVLYTSGSTGRPKGVLVPHRGLSSYLAWAVEAYAPPGARGALLHTSLAFDLSLTALFVPLLAGQPVRLVPEADGGESLAAALLVEHDLAFVKMTPSHARLLAAQLPPDVDLAGRCRALILGGEGLSAEDLALFRDRAPDIVVFNEYGPTETVVGCTVHAAAAGSLVSGPVPIGRPAAGARIYLLDRTGNPVPPGAAGEVWIGGPGVAWGYAGRPDLTAGRFQPDPFGTEPGGRLYRTGDLSRMRPDGVLAYLGRCDHQVKIRGFRIEPAEVEAALLELHRVEQALVMAREDSPGEVRLVAYVVTRWDWTLAELRESLRRTLPAPMVPSAFVLLRELPLTANGKVDRAALPRPERLQAHGYVPPRTPVEELLAGIWEELLQIDRAGIHDDFFDLGGHSLLATQVVSRVLSVLGVELPLRVMFEAPTLAGLAAAVEAAQAQGRPVPPPIVPLPRIPRGGMPLSFAQQRLWFLHQLEPESPAYNLPLALRLAGPLDPGCLAASLDALVARHETLRTVFATEGGLPVQRILPAMPLPLPCADLSALPPEDLKVEAWRISRAEGLAPFDLSRPPVVRPRLLRLAPQEHALLLTLHHVSADGWSTEILTRELAALYEAYGAGREPDLPPLPVQYADFAAWQREWLQGEELERQIDYWRRHLAGAPEALELPADHPRPPVPRHRGGNEGLELPPELTPLVASLSRRAGSSPFMTLAAAYVAVLHRYTGQGTVVVGTPIANRNRAETEGLVGFFVNTLALRADLGDDPPFLGLLARVRESALGAYTHQDLPFERLVDEIQPRRDRSRPPIFQVFFVFEQALAGGPPKARDVTFSAFGGGAVAARYDLTLLCSEQAGNALAASCHYDADLFEPATAARLLRSFSTLLAGALATPETPVSELPLLDEDERRQVLAAWSDTGRDLGPPAPLQRAFEEQAARAPEAAAVLFEGAVVTYGQLNRRADLLARHLRRLGVIGESRVGVACERSPDALVALLAVLKAGGAYVAVDPEAPRDRLAAIAMDAGFVVLLTQEKLAPALAGLAPQLLAVDGEMQEAAALPPELEIPPHSAAYVVYTSGSTGVPKGVVVPHGAAVNFVRGMAEEIGLAAHDRILLFAPLSFDASVLQIFPALSRGAAVAVHRDPRRLSAAEILAFCAEHGVTVLDLPAALWRQWVEEVAGRREPLPASLRTFLTGGESVPVALLGIWAGLVSGREAAFLSSYGPTEATVTATVFHAGSQRGALPAGGPNVPLGRPLANVQVYLLDRKLQPVPRGVPGELFLGGAALARGYLGQPAATAEGFVPDGLGGAPGSRLYRTGDLARHRADGELEFLGRADHQVKIRGFRLELAEVEAVLAQHPAVRENVAVVREDLLGDRRLVAYVVPLPEAVEPPAASDLRAFAAGRLPHYAVPSSFVVLPALPLLPSGKVDRAALPVPDPAQRESGPAPVPPRTAVEKVVAGIWSTVLGVEAGAVGVQDNFFELGGHSLSATQVVARIREELEVDLELRHVFEAPTVEGVAAALLADPDRRRRVERAAEITVELAEMSEEDVEAMLLAEAGEAEEVEKGSTE